MSTVYSTPPNNAKPSHPVGFNDQTYDDPFFPSSSNEEELFEVTSDHSPAHQADHTASSSSPLISNNIRLQQSISPANGRAYLQPPFQPALTNGSYSSLSPQSHTEQEAGNESYDFLSPNAYISDNGYNASSEHTATPEFDSSFYLENNFGFLADPNQDVQLDHSSFLDDIDIQQPRTNGDASNHTHPSVGTASLSSHLMSPELTDSAGPGSRHATSSPPLDVAHIKIENFDSVTSAFNMHNIGQANTMNSNAQMQQTPTLTESSKGTSPDLAASVPVTACPPTPVFRVEECTRGDSPARGAGSNGRSASKHSRTRSHSSYLGVNRGDESEQEDDLGHPRTRTGSPGVPVADRIGLDPEARLQMGDVEVSNFKEQEETAQIALKNADVFEWLGSSEGGVENANEAAPTKPAMVKMRQKAKSVGNTQSLSQANLESLKTAVIDSHIPGPGILIDEESGDDDDDDGDEMEDDEDEVELAEIEDPPAPETGVTESINKVPGEALPGVYNELPNQPQLYRAKLWQDPLYDSSDPGVKMQPDSSNAAIMRFQKRAGEIDTMSRVATWGTRRMSESDLVSLFHRFSFSDKQNDEAKVKRERRGSFLEQAAAKLLSHKRSNSLLKRHESESSKPQNSRPPLDHGRKESQGSRHESLGVPQSAPKGLQRMSSLTKRPKSPRINTGSAVAAMAHMAALGASGSVSATATTSPTAPWPKNVMKRKSPGETNGLGIHAASSSSATDLGLAGLWAGQGGPPMPTLASPPKVEETSNNVADAEKDEEDDDDDAVEDQGVTMDLSIKSDSITPTLEGFKSNIRQLNPRLPSFMFDRIAQEQLRRFKKLMDFKVKHAHALSVKKCASGRHCTGLGGEPTYLPSRSSGREPENPPTGFSVAGLGQSDEDAGALADGIVTPAQFPPGVPMPPVKRLPAEFECSLCFKVKKLHKPSDWSKHVHEDVQPFTCTFPKCAEPKSFKRKADWVRHENERHRQLEWWMCNMNECSHKCYRKDNFVQHLVREHKLPEPKVKTAKNGRPAVRGPSTQKARNKHMDENTEDSSDDIDLVWRLVEECRYETTKNPKDEACKFCGNICNSWKKLTVHLAKHMEQISMPVLGIVKQKEVTPETVISPIEQRITSQQTSMSPTAQSPFSQGNASSSYGMPMATMGELPGAFTSLQSHGNYFGTPLHQSVNHQHVSPATYPPPTGHGQQMAASYAQSGGTSYPMANYASFGGPSAPQFDQPHSSSPENLYGGMKPPSSQPRSMPFENGEGYQYAPQQQTFSHPTDTPVYQFGNATSTPYPQQTAAPSSYAQQTTPPTSYPQQTPLPTSYPQQQLQQQTFSQPPSYHSQSTLMNGQQMPMQFNQPGQMQYPHADDGAAFYAQRRRNGGSAYSQR